MTRHYLLFLNAFRYLQYRFLPRSRSRLNVDRVTIYICFSNKTLLCVFSVFFFLLILIECARFIYESHELFGTIFKFDFLKKINKRDFKIVFHLFSYVKQLETSQMARLILIDFFQMYF